MENEKALAILNSFVLDKKISYLSSGYEDKLHFRDLNFDRKNIGPFTEQEVWDNKEVNSKLVFSKIPKQLYNKKFKIDEFDIHIQYINEYKVEPDPYEERGGRKGMYFRGDENWNIIIVYCGVHISMGKYWRHFYLNADKCTPKQTNWSWLTPSVDKPYILNRYSIQLEYSIFDKLEEFIKGLNISSLSLEEDDLPKQTWYDFDKKR